MTTSLNATTRERQLAALADRSAPLDLLVVGGGITGAGIALDAASRGLSVALVEARDLAFGTSRWSSKLVHGGLRYLASGNVRIARESARERHLLMTAIAPHLIRPMTQVVPLLPEFSHFSRALVRAGFLLGDGLRAMAGTSPQTLSRPRKVDARAALALVPALRTAGLAGALTAQDGQLVDDARLVVAVARTAAGCGASVLTRTRAEQVTDTGALLVDALAGRSFHVSARAVVNAAGVWAGQVDPRIKLRPSRGTHLVLDASALGDPTGALTVQVPGHLNRFVFALPQQLGRVYVGLTDEEAPGEIPDEPQPAESEVDFLLDTVSSALARPLSRADVRGRFAGLRPLLDGGDGATSDLSRDHAVLAAPGKPITVVGGKLTTYRKMAQDAVDAATARAKLHAGPCATESLPLVGACGRTGASGPLAARYGGEAGLVLGSATTSDPGAQIAEGIDVSRAEIEFAFAHEGAMDVDDVLHRRTRIGLVPEDARRARGAVEAIAAQLRSR
ncbi:MAG: glycerol-3-phosphate dehydrogenase/oxidase [Segniliparus sp.]|uniref:glycerol-3-phosphate dehydrogenase/oxidase n=1 Tax=Segniliparus sp. TaxID=2804064 RepID=UPI003F36FD78